LLQNIQAARHVCSGVREADVEVGTDEVESWAETAAARAKAATVAKKRILKTWISVYGEELLGLGSGFERV